MTRGQENHTSGPRDRERQKAAVPYADRKMTVTIGLVDVYEPKSADTVSQWAAELRWWPAHLNDGAGGSSAHRVASYGADPAEALTALGRHLSVAWPSIEAEINGTSESR